MFLIHNRKLSSKCFRQLPVMCDRDQRFSSLMKILQKLCQHILCFFIQSGKRLIYLGDNTVLCVLFILTKWRGKTSLLGGCGSMKKRGGDMHYMNGCGGELR